MHDEQLMRLTQSRDWFNHFFQALRQIYERMSTLLETTFPLPQQGLYYLKSNFLPSIPPYYVLGMGGEGGAVQVYTVIDLEMFRHPFFRREPSLVVVAHADGDKHLHIEDYGKRIMGDGPIEADEPKDHGVLSGSIRGQTRFHAFQLGLEHFEEGRDLDHEITTEIIDRLKPLFPFESAES